MIQQVSQIIPESSNSECQRDRDTEFTQVLQREIKSKTKHNSYGIAMSRLHNWQRLGET